MSQEALERQVPNLSFCRKFLIFVATPENKELFAKAAGKNTQAPRAMPLSPLAKKYKASFLLGSILEKAPQGRAYNTSVFIDPSGEITAKYRKIHLFDAWIGDKIVREADCFRAGRRPTAVKLGEFKMGLSICYDLRFPDLYQNYARRGVEILTAPSCFTRKTGEAHWEALLRARAIENLSYVLAPNQIGIDARGMHAHGHSMIISPWGEVIARGSEGSRKLFLATLIWKKYARHGKYCPAS